MNWIIKEVKEFSRPRGRGKGISDSGTECTKARKGVCSVRKYGQWIKRMRHLADLGRRQAG